MRRWIESGFVLVLVSMLTSCTASVETPVTPTPIASVNFDTPQMGTIIYSDTIYASGTATGLNEDFILRVISADQEKIAEVIVSPEGGTWEIQIPHSYTGDPTEITLIALPFTSDDITSADLGVTAVVLSPTEVRPDGIYGLILQPTSSEVVGGEQIPVFGVISGLTGETLVVSLVAGDRILSTQELRFEYPNPLDEIPWMADLSTSARTGSAMLSLSYTDSEGRSTLLDSVDIVLSEAAG